MSTWRIFCAQGPGPPETVGLVPRPTKRRRTPPKALRTGAGAGAGAEAGAGGAEAGGVGPEEIPMVQSGRVPHGPHRVMTRSARETSKLAAGVSGSDS